MVFTVTLTKVQTPNNNPPRSRAVFCILNVVIIVALWIQASEMAQMTQDHFKPRDCSAGRWPLIASTYTKSVTLYSHSDAK